MADGVMIELQDLTEKVNEAVNYVNEYKKSGMKANANDMMTLYKRKHCTYIQRLLSMM